MNLPLMSLKLPIISMFHVPLQMKPILLTQTGPCLLATVASTVSPMSH